LRCALWPGAERLVSAESRHRDLRLQGGTAGRPEKLVLVAWGWMAWRHPLAQGFRPPRDCVWPCSDSLCRRGGRLRPAPDPERPIAGCNPPAVARPRRRGTRRPGPARPARRDAPSSAGSATAQSAASRAGAQVVASSAWMRLFTPCRSDGACRRIAETATVAGRVSPPTTQLGRWWHLCQTPSGPGPAPPPARRDRGGSKAEAHKGEGDSSGGAAWPTASKPTATLPMWSGLVSKAAQPDWHVLEDKVQAAHSVEAHDEVEPGGRVIGALLEIDQLRLAARRAAAPVGWRRLSTTRGGPRERQWPQAAAPAGPVRGENSSSKTHSAPAARRFRFGRGFASTISLPAGGRAAHAAHRASSRRPGQVVSLSMAGHEAEAVDSARPHSSTAYFSSSRRPGVVLRVSARRTPVLPGPLTRWRMGGAIRKSPHRPDSGRAYSGTSAVGQAIELTSCWPACTGSRFGHQQGGSSSVDPALNRGSGSTPPQN